MSIETISFLLGAGLIVVAVIGGGIEVREIKVPRIGSAARAAAFVFGLLFVGLTFFLREPPPSLPSSVSTLPTPGRSATQVEAAEAPDPTSPLASDTPAARTADRGPVRQTFTDPLLGEMRLDVCYSFAQRCGDDSATLWCQSKGFARAVASSSENVGKLGIGTRMIGSGGECHADYCAAFSRIECERN